MEAIKQAVIENLKQLTHAPSVQMHDTPRAWQPEKPSRNEGNPDVRDSVEDKEKR